MIIGLPTLERVVATPATLALGDYVGHYIDGDRYIWRRVIRWWGDGHRDESTGAMFELEPSGHGRAMSILRADADIQLDIIRAPRTCDFVNWGHPCLRPGGHDGDHCAGNIPGPYNVPKHTCTCGEHDAAHGWPLDPYPYSTQVTA
jgi:hypothetical protein